MKCSEAKRGCSSQGKMRWFTDLTASWDVTAKQDCSTPDTISINIFGSSGVIPSNLKSQVIMRRRIGKGLIHTHFHADVYSIAFNTKKKKKIYKKYNNNNIFIKQPVKIFKILLIFCNRIFQFNFLMTQEHLLIFWWFLFHFVLYLWLPSPQLLPPPPHQPSVVSIKLLMVYVHPSTYDVIVRSVGRSGSTARASQGQQSGNRSLWNFHSQRTATIIPLSRIASHRHFNFSPSLISVSEIWTER